MTNNQYPIMTNYCPEILKLGWGPARLDELEWSLNVLESILIDQDKNSTVAILPLAVARMIS